MRLLLACMLAAISIAATSCSDKENNILPEPEPAPTDSVNVVTRTVLVYMVATNNLHTGGEFDMDDLNEMQLGASADGLRDGRLLVYHAEPRGIVLKEVTPDGIDTLKVYDSSALSVSAQRMTQVIEDMHELAPADSYGLILWSHATGWIQDGIDESSQPMLRSFGGDGLSNSKKMNVTTLANVLGKHPWDFIYCDCCYMGNIETLYELRKCSPVIVASAAEVPAIGMPYHYNLKYFFDTTLDIEEAMVKAADTTFTTYVVEEEYHLGDCPCTMVVVRTAGLDTVAQCTKTIFSQSDKFYREGYSYQPYTVSGACYYYDFEDYVQTLASEKTLAAWREAMSQTVLYHNETQYIWSSVAIERSCGLSTYILTSASSADTKNYNTLSWYSDVVSALIK